MGWELPETGVKNESGSWLFPKMQQVPGNSQLTICKHGITRKWLHFQNVIFPVNFNLYIVSWKSSGTGVFFKFWPKHSKKSQKVIPGNFWLTYSELEIARNYNFFIIFGDFWEIGYFYVEIVSNYQQFESSYCQYPAYI